MRSSEMSSCASCSLVVYYALPSLARASQRLDMQSNAEGCMRRVLHYFYGFPCLCALASYVIVPRALIAVP